MALDLTCFTIFQPNSSACHSSSVGALSVTQVQSALVSELSSGVCTRSPPETLWSCSSFSSVSATSTRRMFFFTDKISTASCENFGAIMTSKKIGFISSAVSLSHSLFIATMPPNADLLSAAKARLNASRALVPRAVPQGFVCFTTTQAGVSFHSQARSHAASISTILLYDNSFPCSCLAEAMPPFASGSL